MNVHHLRSADAIELTIGQGAKPGTGGLLLGSKISERDRRGARAAARGRPAQPRAAPRLARPGRHDHQDRGAARGHRLAGADLREDGRHARLRRRQAGGEGGRGRRGGGRHGGRHRRVARHPAGPHGHPHPGRRLRGARRPSRTWASTARCSSSSPAGSARGADAAKALALGADAVYIGTAALIALNCNKPIHLEDYAALGTEPYACHHCHTGRCPVGITTQDPELMKRLPDPRGRGAGHQLPALP